MPIMSVWHSVKTQNGLIYVITLSSLQVVPEFDFTLHPVNTLLGVRRGHEVD